MLRARRAADEPAPDRVVARFSQAALGWVALPVGAGVALAGVHVGRLGAVLDSSYGRTLAVKVALVAAVVTVAAINRLRLVPALRRGSPQAARRLRRNVVVEVVGIKAVLGVTAVLVNVSPPA